MCIRSILTTIIPPVALVAVTDYELRVKGLVRWRKPLKSTRYNNYIIIIFIYTIYFLF